MEDASEIDAAEEESALMRYDDVDGAILPAPPPCGNSGIEAVLRSPIVVPLENSEALARGDPVDDAKDERECRGFP